MDALLPLIYHEKQEPGSMLCAQHALNSLLQGDYFTAPDLSAIARSLDTLEQSYSEGNDNRTSTNMDDTGFFSVQVLENALDVWGLSLIRWRSEAMKPYQDHPHTQFAFILNLEQHWFTLRSFGDHTAQGQGHTHWFNLNSFLQRPEWVSKTYLGMMLQQAESEGYSVFVVTPVDPTTPSLPRSSADDLASEISEPSTNILSERLSTIRTPHAPEGLENEDLELQTALQASLASEPEASRAGPSVPNMSSGPSGPSIARGARAPGPNAHPASFLIPSSSSFVHPPEPADPVAASAARNRALLERMQREQEFALQEQYDEEIAHFAPGDPRAAQAGTAAEGDETDGDEMRRAIMESLARQRRARDDDDDDDDEMNDDDFDPDAALGRAQPAWHGHSASMAGDHVYDDDDAELQAALKASLETVPAGFQVPEFAPLAPAPPVAPVASGARARAPPAVEADASSATDTEPETEPDSEIGSVPEARQEDVSVEEMRRRRLARFG